MDFGFVGGVEDAGVLGAALRRSAVDGAFEMLVFWRLVVAHEQVLLYLLQDCVRQVFGTLVVGD